MLNTANKVTDANKLTAVADASFVIGISLCQQWDTLEMLIETLIIADEVWSEIVERGEGQPGRAKLERFGRCYCNYYKKVSDSAVG